jgi:azurin/lysophospholipase L1-like esterase
MISSAMKILGVASLAIVLSASAHAQFVFEKGDHVCLIGNQLADRMQHDGWMETQIQSQAADKQIVIRNLGRSGDSVSKRPRTSNEPSLEDVLSLSKADVIFCFFGYNESYGDDAGLAKFKADYGTLIDTYRARKFNGKSEPRFVLFSPISHENLHNRNLPDGTTNNARLAKYAAAIKDVKKAMFVDLFAPSKALYDAAKSPLTLNGVHLSDEGNRQLAEVIASALFGAKVTASPKLENLRQAVLDKNFYWYSRYRASDANDIWGGRAGLRFVDNQSNGEVMTNEIAQLDVMTANRDPLIWAVAAGRDAKVDDSNVPKPVKVISNVGGGSKSSNAMKEGSTTYLSSEDTVKSMTVAKGFEVNIFADEKMFPELANPVQMNVDAKGRLWVAAWKDYPKVEPGRPVEDRLLILSDPKRTGKAEKCTVFAKVPNPTGFAFWNGGVLVASAPDLLYLKDTNDDDVADICVHLLQGLDAADTHHTANNFCWGPDGGLYWQRGVFIVENVETPWGPSFESGAAGEYRFDPFRFTFGFHAANGPNSHGISFDYWGYHFATDGTSGNAFQVVPDAKGFKMRPLFKKTVRPVPSSGIISSSQFPPANQGNFMVCNSIGFLGIKQYKLDHNTSDGTVNGTEVEDLVVSSDKNFRPTDAKFGDDGALYFSDWQNVIIGHMQHNIRDPNRDHAHGRVYRMIAKGRPLQPHVEIAGAPLDALMKNLENPVDGIRYRTRIELSSRNPDEVIAACKVWMKKFDPRKKEDAHSLMEALWLHQSFNVKYPELLNALLKSPEPNARIAAATVKHYWDDLDLTKGGTQVAAEKERKRKKSGVLSSNARQTEVRIATLPEKMQYDVKEFSVKAGSRVKLTFANDDFMPHNLFVVEPGAANEIAIAALSLGEKGFVMNFRPVSSKIIAATKLLDHEKEETLDFVVPKKPGDYEYVCTFPGHYLLMRGIMKVTP